MTVEEFIEETTKIEKFYGKNLEQYEKDIWYQNLKLIPVKRYQEIIKKAFVENKYMPKLAEIIEINKSIPIKNVIPKTEQCNVCKGLGYIIYTKIINNGDKDLHYKYCARCNCKNGNNYLAYPSIAEVNIK